jgi:hypothetical protein
MNKQLMKVIRTECFSLRFAVEIVKAFLPIASQRPIILNTLRIKGFPMLTSVTNWASSVR